MGSEQRFDDNLCPRLQGTWVLHVRSRQARCSWWRNKRVGGHSQVPTLHRPALTFINMLVMGDQAWLSMKPPSLLQLLLFRCVSTASCTRRSTCPDVLSNIQLPLKSMQWPVLMLCSPTADFSGCCRRMSLVFFAPCLDSSSTLSYIHFSAFTWHPIYAWDLQF